MPLQLSGQQLSDIRAMVMAVAEGMGINPKGSWSTEMTYSVVRALDEMESEDMKWDMIKEISLGGGQALAEPTSELSASTKEVATANKGFDPSERIVTGVLDRLAELVKNAPEVKEAPPGRPINSEFVGRSVRRAKPAQSAKVTSPAK